MVIDTKGIVGLSSFETEYCADAMVVDIGRSIMVMKVKEELV